VDKLTLATCFPVLPISRIRPPSPAFSRMRCACLLAVAIVYCACDASVFNHACRHGV
jgi:hypothetical protein